MKKNDKLPFLRHYIKIPYLLKILETGNIKLVKPDNWKDENDIASVNAYKRYKKAKVVCVFCFAYGNESVHHWLNYAPKNSCCVYFNEVKLFSILSEIKDIKKGKVIYIPSKELLASKLKKMRPEKIPFIKRRPYDCEKEYRIIWTGNKVNDQPKINVLDCIEKITLSPNFDVHLLDKIEKAKKKTKRKIDINRSRILAENGWISKFNNLY